MAWIRHTSKLGCILCIAFTITVNASSLFYVEQGEIIEFKENAPNGIKPTLTLFLREQSNSDDILLLDYKEKYDSNQNPAGEKVGTPVFLYMCTPKSKLAPESYDSIGSEVYVLDSSGTSRLLSAASYSDARLSPDARTIAFTVHPGDLVIESVTGKVIARLPKATTPSWGMDSRSVAYVSLTSYGNGEIPDEAGPQGISVFELETGNNRIITSNHLDYSPVYTPLGSYVLFLSLNRSHRMWKFDLNTSALTPIVELTNGFPDWGNGETFSWSSDGAYLFYDAPLRVRNENPSDPLYSVLMLRFSREYSDVYFKELVKGAKAPRWLNMSQKLAVLRETSDRLEPTVISITE